jgi:UDP-N-acetylmuramyl tripeptide synthase
MRIVDLIHGLDVRIVGDDPGGALGNLRVCDITEDSRTVMPGSLFIARKGENSDGKRFVGAAIAAGAVAVLTDEAGFELGSPAPRAGSLDDQGKGPGSESRGTQEEARRGASGYPSQPVALLTAGDIQLAIAMIAERFYGKPSSKMIVIGVTGTNGKTTTTFLIHQMLNALGIRCGLIGTVVIDDGVETAAASLTTPPALGVSRTLARMLDAGCKAAVMEVSSHALHQRRVGAVSFNAGVFTNLTGDHLDYHGTMEEYGAAKAMLFDALPADGVAVVNIQDPAHARMVRGVRAGVRVVGCAVADCKMGGTGGSSARGVASAGLGVAGRACSMESEGGCPNTTGGQVASATPLTTPMTECRARVMGADTSGTGVEFTGPWGHRASRIPLVGAFNVMNALQAIATVHGLWGGTDEDALSFEIIAGALERACAPPGRLEPVTREGEPIQVFVDYAHSDDALATVLRVLREAMGRSGHAAHGPGKGTSAVGAGPVPQAGHASTGQIWCVFGCGGDRDRTKRPRMGKVAAELADRVVITSDNPRTEDAGGIIDEIRVGVPALAAGKVAVEPDRERAIRWAVGQARPGDTIIIAGKGHEDYQILPDPKKKGGTITRHFDDREVARGALKERGIGVREREGARVSEDEEDEGDMGDGASLVLGG